MKRTSNATRAKGGKHFKAVLPSQRWEMLLSTFSSADIKAIWQALFHITTLFRVTAVEVAEASGLSYPEAEDHNVSQYLVNIHHSSAINES